MNWIAWILAGLGILAVLLFSTGWWRYVLTGYLIARVTPYEQPGGGAGRILIIGDSTGYGTGASKSADSVAGQLGKDYATYAIINNSGNGRTIAGALEVVQQLSDDEQYDLVVLQIGANDMLGGASADQTVKRQQELIEATQPHASSIIVLTAGNIGATPLFTGDEAERLQTTSRDYTAMMLTIAQQYQDVSFVALFDEPENDPFLAKPRTYTALDGLHPTSAGYGIWYNKAKPYIAQVLERD